MEKTQNSEVLHNLVRLTIILSKFIKQNGVQDVTQTVVAKDIFSTLSKQIVQAQTFLRLSGENSVLDIDDNAFYLKEYEDFEEYATDLETVFAIVKQNPFPQDALHRDNFEKHILERLENLVSALITSLKVRA